MTMFCTLGHVVEVFFTGAVFGAVVAMSLTIYAFRKVRG
jgi:hypothetical protein